MSDALAIRVYERGQLLYSGDLTGSVELGRQNRGEDLFATSPGLDRVTRLVIAGPTEDRVSRRHALVQPREGNRVRIENRSGKAPIGLPDGRGLAPGDACELTLPTVLSLGHKSIRLLPSGDPLGASLQGLDQPTLGPRSAASPSLAALGIDRSAGAEVDAVLRCLNATIQVLKSAANDTDFFQKAAQAVVEGVGLDGGRVLALDGETWKTIARFDGEDATDDDLGLDPPTSRPPSQGVLNRVRREGRTFWHSPSQPGSGLAAEDGSSLVGITSVVAAPILDADDHVKAVLYGDRRALAGLVGSRGISRLEAVLMDLLAGSVAAGLARLDQERVALASRAQFEQFFTPELARLLADRPDLLVGQDVEITVLFADIRAFSRITRDLGPERTLEWTGDVLSTLSDQVLHHQGVLVDYIGDELMAMWGAPDAQPDHAQRAAAAALAMLDTLPTLNARWGSTLNEPMGLGIGLNTGVARVGNTGSRRKFKYGPLGDPVNIASRVQGANKYFKSDLLITRATRDRLGPAFSPRRLGTVRVVNIAEPIELFELAPANRPGWDVLRGLYETALTAYESAQFRQAARILGNLMDDHPDDGPSLNLLARAVAALVETPNPFDPSYLLPGK